MICTLGFPKGLHGRKIGLQEKRDGLVKEAHELKGMYFFYIFVSIGRGPRRRRSLRSRRGVEKKWRNNRMRMKILSSLGVLRTSFQEMGE